MSLSQQFKSMTLSLSLLLVLSVVSTQIQAENTPSETCTSAAKLFNEGDVEGALEEAKWCVTQLEQLKQSKSSSYFKDEINGYKGEKLNSQQTMGISIVERSYSKNGQVIKVSLSGGVSDSMNNAFAAIASFGLQAVQGEKIRIQRRTAVIVNNNAKLTQVIVTLKSSGMLTFESKNTSDDDIVAFAKAFPVADLDDSRR